MFLLRERMKSHLRIKTKVIFFLSFFFFFQVCFSQTNPESHLKTGEDISVGAMQLYEYLPLIKGKSVAIVANQTSMISNTHLVDSLLALNVKIKCVFAPEHGFRGTASAGQKIATQVDQKTGLLIISLYGKHLKPSVQDLKDVDVVIFDIQDVGARFYTYISTLQFIMEACAEQGKEVIVLDRPNPNGFYVDGPVLDMKVSSFVGMNPIPVVYGLTIGEYATMLNGEHWLDGEVQCKLTVIRLKNYSHKDLYRLPVKPSPNLYDMTSVYLYPSLCFFEGTKVSVGRGTLKPFHIIGYPGFKEGDFLFTPKSIPGVVDHPLYQDSICNGLDLSEFGEMYPVSFKNIYLYWLKGMYDSYPDKGKFFNDFFEKLAGTSKLRQQIINGIPEEVIRKNWEEDLKKYNVIRKKYLLYEDF